MLSTSICFLHLNNAKIGLKENTVTSHSDINAMVKLQGGREGGSRGREGGSRGREGGSRGREGGSRGREGGRGEGRGGRREGRGVEGKGGKGGAKLC